MLPLLPFIASTLAGALSPPPAQTLQSQFDEAFGNTSRFLVVLNYRSNVIIDWTTPQKAIVTAAESEALAGIETYSEGIGHAAVFFRGTAGTHSSLLSTGA